jgi:hypothetical protein
VFAFGAQINDVLTYDGTGWIPSAPAAPFLEGIEYNINIQGNVLGLDSSILLDAATNTLNGNVTGHLIGSVFADDSSLIVDGINNLINVSKINHTSFDLTVQNEVVGNRSVLRVDTVDEISRVILSRQSNSVINNSMVYGRLDFQKNDPGGISTSAAIGADNLGLFFTFNPTEISSTESEYIVFSSTNKLGIGTFTPTEKLDVRGNGIFSGEVQAAAFKGSLMSDDSTTLVDAINGVITAQHVQFGSYSDIDRPTGVNGMVIYNSTTNRFQGYQNNVWINLDDGTSA